MMSLSQIEREAIVLQIVIETIQATVNREVLEFSPGNKNIQVTPKSSSQLAMFNVLLADMLERVDPKLLGTSGSLLDALESVCETPQLGTGEPAVGLRTAVQALRQWLEEEITVRVWFPSIDTEVPEFRLRRRDFITICGNISKHNVSRLTLNAQRLSKLLEANHVAVDWVDALRALDDFQTRFHDDILVYHTTTIAELLNNLRWAIHEYLRGEYKRSYVAPSSEEDPRYSFTYPQGLDNAYAKSRYWDLMNSVRGRPWIARFTGTPNLKGDY